MYESWKKLGEAYLKSEAAAQSRIAVKQTSFLVPIQVLIELYFVVPQFSTHKRKHKMAERLYSSD